MDLLLWRHAEAADGSPDKARPLTEHGQKQARRMAKWLGEHAPADLRILVSPALRTQQTVQAWRQEYETSDAVFTNVEPESVLDAAGWPDAGGAVMVVGHQPTLGRVASLLLNGRDGDMSFKKGALWWFTYKAQGDGPTTILRAVVSADLT